MLIGILGWLLSGLIAGFIASKMVNLRGDEPGFGMAVAAAAAVFSGWLFGFISGTPVSAFNIWSLLIASCGAVTALAIWHTVRRRVTAPGRLYR